MKMRKWILCAAAIAAVNAGLASRTYAGLFKIDFGQQENERIPTDADGNELPPPEVLKDWNVIPTWTFADPNANVVDGSASIKGTANAEQTEVTWKLTDFSTSGDADVTLTMLDNKALAESLNPDTPPYALGQIGNNPTKEGLTAVYDGIVVPGIVKDDYMYRNPDTAGSEILMRFANLNPGLYNVTVFEGRTTDSNGRYGKVWVDDITGKNEPAEQNTGNYAGVTATGQPAPLGRPRTVTVEVKAGQFLWFAEMEDNSGGISGLILRSVTEKPPVIDISKSVGLFKIDFGHLENERVPVDAEGTPTGEAPPALTDWNVIPTWTFADPNANVLPNSASLSGVANDAATEVTWKLNDFSADANKSVTMTILDNAALAESLNPETPPYALGQTANNPTKEAIDSIYDGVVVPGLVKDDYNYRNPDTAGSELLMRFAGLKPGTYNVTAFEGRTTDSNGRFGKVWVDDVTGKKEPTEQNTGNYAGVDLAAGGIADPVGQPRTVTVTLKAGEYLWFAEMEDNSGGISGLIIRGVGATTGGTTPAFTSTKVTSGQLRIEWTGGGTLEKSAGIPGGWSDVSGATSPYTAPAGGTAAFYRLRQ